LSWILSLKQHLTNTGGLATPAALEEQIVVCSCSMKEIILRALPQFYIFMGAVSSNVFLEVQVLFFLMLSTRPQKVLGVLLSR
jgi:hypothetical protein